VICELYVNGFFPGFRRDIIYTKSAPIDAHTYIFMLKHHSLGSSIAVAEGVSTAAEVGAVWLLGENDHLIEPVRDFVAKRIIYPCERCMGEDTSKTPHQGKYDPELLEKARKRASLLVKGTIMMAAGFATHVPTQMAMEGRFDAREIKKVVMGKGLGVGATLVSLWLAEKARPGIVGEAEDKLKKVLGRPECPPGEKGEACRRQDDFCKLLVLDIPSSVMSGLVNYCFTRGRAL